MVHRAVNQTKKHKCLHRMVSGPRAPCIYTAIDVQIRTQILLEHAHTADGLFGSSLRCVCCWEITKETPCTRTNQEKIGQNVMLLWCIYDQFHYAVI